MRILTRTKEKDKTRNDNVKTLQKGFWLNGFKYSWMNEEHMEWKFNSFESREDDLVKKFSHLELQCDGFYMQEVLYNKTEDLRGYTN